MIDSTLLSHCRNLASKVAPETQERPLYICDSHIFDGLSIDGDCLGFASSEMLVDAAMRERIADWSEPGPLICLDGDSIREKYGEQHYRDGVLSTLLHELAHVILFYPDPLRDIADILHTPAVQDWLQKRIEGQQTQPAAQPGSDGDIHGKAFVRIATHLLARSQFQGWNILSPGLFGDAWYLSQPAHWVLALLQEVTEHQFAPFAEIISRPPPKAFTEMWDSSMDFYYRRGTK